MDSEKKAIFDSYKKEVEKLEISEDISDNLKNSKTVITTIISEDKLTEEEVVEMVKIIKEHFGLDEESKQDFVSFALNLFKTQSKTKIEENYQNSILKNAINSKGIDKIFPAIDYRENLGMIYGVKGYDNNGETITYVGTSKKKIYEIEKAKEFGIITTHTENIDTRFSLYEFSEYIKGNKSVNASDLFQTIKKFIKRYVIVAEEFYDVLVTYIFMTYVYVLFQVIPYLWVNGESGTGKSTIMKLMNKFCFNSMFCTNINPANIFRQIDNDGSTIIIDEFEKMYGEDKQEIIKLLNQGFNKDGVVPRCIGSNYKVKKFRSFSPKVMGGINNIDGVLFERCIKYTTQRVRNANIIKFRDNEQEKKEIKKIVGDLYIFGLCYAEKIKTVYDSGNISYKGNTPREDDLWNPLLCIAKVIDEEKNLNIQEHILTYAKQLSQEKFQRYVDSNSRLQLLNHLYICLDEEIVKPQKLKDGRYGVSLGSLYNYFRKIREFSWISSPSVLGKKLTQWFGFEKKRELYGEEYGMKRKATYYIIDISSIKKLLEDEGVTLSDFE